MGFADQYVWSLNAGTLQDDEAHHATEPLFAAAVADISDAELGSLLSRVKFGDGSISKLYESGTQNLAGLIRLWRTVVRRKGVELKWVRMTAAWDVQAACALFDRVADQSLAYWLDGRCGVCNGAAQTPERRLCPCCKGSGRGELPSGGLEREKVLDMVAELEDQLLSHNSRAATRLRSNF